MKTSELKEIIAEASKACGILALMLSAKRGDADNARHALELLSSACAKLQFALASK